jgi:hypothetical protein
MDYRQAQNIRNKSFGTLLAEQEGGAFSSLRKTISLRSKARATRIKQTFDPMNIAKFLTFGSNWAPAMLGKATGRSRESINFFSGVNRGRRASEIGERSTRIPQLQSTGGFSKTLEKIYVLMKKSLDDERKRKQIQNNYKEENDILVTDTKSLKQYLYLNSDIFIFDTKICHLGLCVDSDAVRDTLFEFFLITQCSKIKTYCKIHHISGFVKWISKVYDIPIECFN